MIFIIIQSVVMQIQLLREGNMIVSYSMEQQEIKLTVRVFKNSYISQIYEGHLPSIQSDRTLSEFFESNEKIIQYIKIKENVQIDIEMMSIKIMYSVTTRKNKKIQLLEIKLQLVQNQNIDQLLEIIKKCKDGPDLKNCFIKKSIQTIASFIHELISQRQKFKIQSLPTFQFGHINLNQQFQLLKNEVKTLLNNNILNKKQEQNDVHFIHNNLQQGIKIKIKKLDQRMSRLQSKYFEQNQKICSSVKQLEQQISAQLTQKLTQLTSIFVTAQQANAITDKLHKLQQDVDKIQLLNQKQNRQQINKIYSSSFKVTGNLVEYIGQNELFTQYIFNKRIPYDEQYSFRIKIVQLGKVKYWNFIGIVDYQKQKSQRISSDNNSLCYYRNRNGKGYKYPTRSWEGNGFGLGDIVEVVVHLSKNSIKWLVNGKYEASLTHPSMSDRKITFMPFVQLWYNNTIIEWIDDNTNKKPIKFEDNSRVPNPKNQ